MAAGGFVAGAAVVGPRAPAPAARRGPLRRGRRRRRLGRRGGLRSRGSVSWSRSSAAARCSSTCTCSAARAASAAGTALARPARSSCTRSSRRPARSGCRAGPAMDGMLRRRGGVLERLLHHGDVPVRRAGRADGRPRASVSAARAANRGGGRATASTRMRFALGVDEDLRPFCGVRARPLIGRSLRRRPWLRVGAPSRALRGARVGDLRAADRVRACGRDRAPHGGRLGRRWAGGGDAVLRDLPPSRPCWPAPHRHCCSRSTSRGSRALALVQAAREVAAGRSESTAPASPTTSAAGGGCGRSPGSGRGPWRCSRSRPGPPRPGPRGRPRAAASSSGRLLSGGDPRAVAEEHQVRELFAPYGAWAGLAGGPRRALRPARTWLGPAVRAQARGSCCAVALQEQRERRAGAGGADGVLELLAVEGGFVDHRIAPLVERDPLGQQLRADAVGLAGDRVDAYVVAHGHGSRRASRPTAGSGSSPARAHALAGAVGAWSSNSSANTRSALRITLTAPSGCAAGAATREVSEARASACAARRRAEGGTVRRLLDGLGERDSPWTQGPHWRALCAGQPAGSRDGFGHGAGVGDSSRTTPAPRRAPCGASASWESASCKAIAEADAHEPA